MASRLQDTLAFVTLVALRLYQSLTLACTGQSLKKDSQLPFDGISFQLLSPL